MATPEQQQKWENIAFWIMFAIFMLVFIYLFATGRAFT